MAEFDGITSYLKVGPRRLRDAAELLEHPTLEPNEAGAEQRHLRAAVYLAGYAVEVVLKAYIISKSPPAQSLGEAVTIRRARGLNVPDLLGAEGHRLDLLLSLTDLEEKIDNDRSLKKDWVICTKWKSTWRYDPTIPSMTFSREFTEAAQRIYRWVERQV